MQIIDKKIMLDYSGAEVICMAVAHKGSISMGMVLIPIGLYKTTVDNDIHFTLTKYNNILNKTSK
mgnify:CR=1 FL=1